MEEQKSDLSDRANSEPGNQLHSERSKELITEDLMRVWKYLLHSRESAFTGTHAHVRAGGQRGFSFTDTESKALRR